MRMLLLGCLMLDLELNTTSDRRSRSYRCKNQFFFLSLHPPRHLIRADVFDPFPVRSLFDLTEQTFKSPPHIDFHSADILDPNYHSISSTSLAIFDLIMSVNAHNTFFVLQEAANQVVGDGSGRIIALSSWPVATNRPGYGVYTASKTAVEAMVKTSLLGNDMSSS